MLHSRYTQYLITLLLLSSCGNQTGKPAVSGPASPATAERPKAEARKELSYRVITKDSLKHLSGALNATARTILASVNRVDLAHLALLDSVILPDHLDYAIQQYSPFPDEVPELNDVRKVLIFSYPAQFFAAYEQGRLVYTGPTNMGRKKDPTPEGLYYCNWKAEQTKSTFNDEWELKWNFNIENKEGIGFHEYALPGYPASHSCLRLNETDARFLYSWAEQWKLKGTDDVIAKGTPVLVWGTYPFGSSKPWMALTGNAHALDIAATDIKQAITPFKAGLLQEQQKTAQAADTAAHQ